MQLWYLIPRRKQEIGTETPEGAHKDLQASTCESHKENENIEEVPVSQTFVIHKARNRICKTKLLNYDS